MPRSNKNVNVGSRTPSAQNVQSHKAPKWLKRDAVVWLKIDTKFVFIYGAGKVDDMEAPRLANWTLGI